MIFWPLWMLMLAPFATSDSPFATKFTTTNSPFPNSSCADKNVLVWLIDGFFDHYKDIFGEKQNWSK
jgi:hypothetical protein